MRRGRNAWRFGLVGVGVVVALAGASFATMPTLFGFAVFSRSAPVHLPTTSVRRTDLSVTMTTGGRVDSSDKTIIECELENVSFSVRGYGISAGGSSTILSIVPDGSMVKKGDVLCRLDSSAYEELVRQQTINLDRARADLNQTRLGLEVAQMAVTEYSEGLLGQARKTLNGQIALTRSDFERASDRMKWTRRMYDKGYIAKSQVNNEEFALKRLTLSLAQGRTALDLFERFSAPKYIFILKGDVLAAEAVYNYQQRRFQHFEDRLTLYKQQVERCTISAPHDGFVIHANEEMRNVHIEPGAIVREKQRLFYLPNLAQMEVAALLHESVVKDVQPGMRARVRVEALPNRVLEGHIDSITQLPSQNWFSDVKYFYGMIKLENVPRGLRPGMTAEVEIVMAQKPDVLVVPPESLVVEDGRNVCYVAHDDAVERREVKLGQGTRDYLEITEGLDEGENVVLDPETATSSIVIADFADEPAADQPAEPAAAEPKPGQ